MSVELASAWVSLVPSTKGIAKQVNDEIAGPLEDAAAAAGRSGGRLFGDGLVGNAISGLDRLGESIVSKVTTGAKIAAAAGGAVIAAGITGALVGGLKRVLDTEDATIAFQQMGLSVREIDRALQGVDRTFDGTPFANPDGFNITAQLLATGRSLEQVEGDLLNIANVTSQTLDKDLNRTADTFLRIAATGRMYATDLNFLAQQGIPIRQILAEGLNVTVSELNEMVSAGEITFDTLMDVVGATQRFEGAALSMGQSTRGAARNVLTGIARLGESFLGPLFGENGHAVQALQSIRGALRGLTPAADELGQRFAEWLIPAVGRLSEWFTGTLVPAVVSVVEWFGRNRDTITSVLRVVGPAAGILAGLATGIHLVRRAWMLLQAVTPVGLLLLLVSGLVYAWQNSERFRDVVTSVFERVRGVVTPIVAALVGLVRGFGDTNDQVSGFLANTWAGITSMFTSATTAIVGVITSATGLAQRIWERWGSDIVTFAQRSLSNITRIIQGGLDIVRGIFQMVTGLLTGDWSRFGEGLGRIIGGALNIVRGLASQGLNIVTTLFRTFGTSILETMRNNLVRVVDVFRSLPGRIIAAIPQPHRILYDVGRAIIRGLISGITSMVSSAVSAVGDAVGGVIRGAKSALGIGSPSKVFAEIGSDTLLGMVRGIEAQQTNLLRTTEGTIRSAIIRPTEQVPTLAVAGFTSQTSRRSTPSVGAPGGLSQDQVKLLQRIAAGVERDRVLEMNGKAVGRELGRAHR